MELYEKYPEMFKNCYGGIDIPEYWISVVDRLCSIIRAHRQRMGYKPMQVHQVKEKFAGLRFYNSGEFPVETKMIEYADKACRKICDNCQSKNNVELVSKRNWLFNYCEQCRLLIIK